jgi:hypothetical protein
MQQKKVFPIVIVIVMVVASLAPFLRVRGDTSAALGYLESKTANPWVTMALVAAGQSPSVDYLKATNPTTAISAEAPMLALTAAGKDPRTFPDRDLVAALKSFVSGGQIGDATLENDDIFGILALSSAGVPPTDAAITGAKSFLLAHQNADGGWSFSVGGTSDTNTTAAAIMALLEAGASAGDQAVTNAVAYLRSAQNADGGFPYAPGDGAASDASSDAWIIAALDKLGVDPATWTQGANDPLMHLRSLQAPAGYVQYQAGSGEDSFTPTTTAYAVIALLGKTLPVGKITTPPVTVNFRIEGSSAELCAGTVSAVTAMDVVKNAAAACGTTYHITNTAYGPYLDRIGSDAAAGMTGWLYLVNAVSPWVGAADFALAGGDDVVWYYGDFSWLPTRLTLAASNASSGVSVGATVEAYASGAWSGLAGATLYAGSSTVTSDASGHADLALADGTYRVFAEKTGYVRSGQQFLAVGNVSQASLDLTATIGEGTSTGGPSGSGSGGSSSGGAVAFSVDVGGGSSLGFGSVAPGATAVKSFAIRNQGTSRVDVRTTVTGDDVFRSYLQLDHVPWNRYQVVVESSSTKSAEAELPVPASYVSSGVKNGTLILWATPTP